MAAEYRQGLNAGWSRSPRVQLSEDECCWLDPYRACIPEESEFRQNWMEMEWVDEVRARFARWLNDQLNELPVGDLLRLCISRCNIWIIGKERHRPTGRPLWVKDLAHTVGPLRPVIHHQRFSGLRVYDLGHAFAVDTPQRRQLIPVRPRGESESLDSEASGDLPTGVFFVPFDGNRVVEACSVRVFLNCGNRDEFPPQGTDLCC